MPVALERDESGRIVFGRMTQPIPRVEEVEDPDRVLAAIGAERSMLPIELYDNGARHIVVTLDGVAELGALVRDGAAIEALEITGVNAIARSESWLAEPDALRHTERTRNRLRRRADRLPPRAPRALEWGDEIVIAQGVEMGRPSTLHARADGGDGLIDAVEVGGAAVIVARGEFRLLVRLYAAGSARAGGLELLVRRDLPVRRQPVDHLRDHRREHVGGLVLRDPCRPRDFRTSSSPTPARTSAARAARSLPSTPTSQPAR